jgi:hypothetical protein
MRPPEGMTCHETGHKDLCKDHCMNCWKWVQVMGSDPNTGQETNQWKCADAWMPLLTIENSMQQHQTGAAVESFRNEMVKGNSVMLNQIINKALPSRD